MMASNHFVLAISRHKNELSTPNCRRVAQRIQEAGYQVENVVGSVPLGHWDGDQVQIGQDTVDADADAHVEKRVATMRAAILGNGKMPRSTSAITNMRSCSSWWQPKRERIGQHYDR
jgi:hypothetical protein